jgi:hypothetical protein
MDIFLIIHLLSALFTVIFAVFTAYHLFHKYSVEHRIDKIKSLMMPLLVGRISKVQIIEKLKKEGFSEAELEELYEKFNTEYFRNKTP